MKFRYKRLAVLLPALFAGAVSVSGNALAATSMATPQDMGATAGATTQTISIVLKLHNVDHLEKFIAESVNPDSEHYHRFLSVDEFADRYAPCDEDIQRIKRELHKLGITVNEVYRNHMVIRATGTTDQFNQFFSTEVHNYKEKDKRYSKPNRTVTIPSAISDVVLAVTGLSTKEHAHPRLRRTPEAKPGSLAAADVTKVSLKNGVATTNLPGEFTVTDVANFYNITPLYDKKITGKGRTIGIATLATFDPNDAYAYWKGVGLKVAQNRITQVHLDGGAGTDGADETTLDVEQSGGLAPDAKVIVYDAPNTDSGFIDLFFKAAADNKVDTLSVSWGSAEIAQTPSVMDAQHQAFMELAAQGISVFASSGDSGAYDINSDPYGYPTCTKLLTVDAPANDPYVVAAGGTTLPHTQNRKHGTITVSAERPWGWDYLENYFVTYYGQAYYDTNLFPVGDGGGVSVNYPIPHYQKKIAGTKLSAASQSLICQSDTGPQDLIDLPAGYAGRNLPDVSLNADPYTGYSVYFGGAWSSGSGGTSFVAPQLNGIAALISQHSHSRLGHLNPQLYARLKQFGYASNSPFKAITTGDNLYWQATPSYNPASGIGTLDVSNLAKSFPRSLGDRDGD